jgi:sugar phosphate isomerase/epimerase
MPETSRRGFLRAAAPLAASALFSRGASAAGKTKIKICLNTGNIGVRANLMESIAMAEKFGFEAVDPSVKELAALSDSAMSELLDNLQFKKLVFGSCGQSFPVGQTEEAYSTFLRDLAQTAKTMQRANIRRMVTWLTPVDNKLTYLQNFRLHAQRIGEAAPILGDRGVKLGLEYVAPKTGWTRGKYPFIHTLAEMKELVAEVGKPNLGYTLDSWHWYNAGDTAADVLTLKNEDIVAVHLNDAPAGVPVDQQVDSRRELPMATGVMDIGAFLNALNQVGYDGPAAAEPMSAALRAMPPEEALAKTAEAMRKAFALIQ